MNFHLRLFVCVLCVLNFLFSGAFLHNKWNCVCRFRMPVKYKSVYPLFVSRTRLEFLFFICWLISISNECFWANHLINYYWSRKQMPFWNYNSIHWNSNSTQIPVQNYCLHCILFCVHIHVANAILLLSQRVQWRKTQQQQVAFNADQLVVSFAFFYSEKLKLRWKSVVFLHSFSVHWVNVKGL